MTLHACLPNNPTPSSSSTPLCENRDHRRSTSFTVRYSQTQILPPPKSLFFVAQHSTSFRRTSSNQFQTATVNTRSPFPPSIRSGSTPSSSSQRPRLAFVKLRIASHHVLPSALPSFLITLHQQISFISTDSATIHHHAQNYRRNITLPATTDRVPIIPRSGHHANSTVVSLHRFLPLSSFQLLHACLPNNPTPSSSSTPLCENRDHRRSTSFTVRYSQTQILPPPKSLFFVAQHSTSFRRTSSNQFQTATVNTRSPFPPSIRSGSTPSSSSQRPRLAFVKLHIASHHVLPSALPSFLITLHQQISFISTDSATIHHHAQNYRRNITLPATTDRVPIIPRSGHHANSTVVSLHRFLPLSSFQLMFGDVKVEQ
ncbi:unnamed protein product [Vicia faba]|uniref:Uncharacterized protein n=1 Tax=Vicia faba TaxID=3906 RepID=A0AAV1B3L9_VICFA|nr:unnamed protein product [Vicia faba]